MDMRSLVQVFGGGNESSDCDWSELEERIWLLSIHSSSSSSGTGGGSSGTGGGSSGGAGSDHDDHSVFSDYLDAVDVLDVPWYQRLERFSSSLNAGIGNSAKKHTATATATAAALELTDETTLATLAIAMSCLHLHETVSKLYSCAIHTVQSHMASLTLVDASKKYTWNEQLYNLLVKGYLSNLKVISTIVDYSPSDRLEQVYNEKRTLNAWEEAQFYAMNLVKISQGERLYSTWMIVAVMEHYRSCQRLLGLLSNGESGEGIDNHSEIEKLQQKIKMLPRLAEMMTLKQIQKFVQGGSPVDGGGGGSCGGEKDQSRFPPSADDVRVFVECLDLQGKYQEAIDFLDHIGEKSQSSMVSSSSSSLSSSRRIEDENDIKHHVGSVIQLTEKERLEMKVNLLNKMNRHDEVFQIYSDELLVMMPDQWSYWKGLLDCSGHIATGSESCTMCVHVSSDTICRHVVDRVMEREEGESTNAVEGKGKSKIPLRGPNLFLVELNAHEIKQNDGSKSATKDLAASIITYGKIYVSLVHCCFQDLRAYIELVVTTSCEEGVISDDVKSILEWALELQKNSQPLPSSNSNLNRKSELRAYIASIKICFEIWYQLCGQCPEDDEAKQAVDKAMASFVPSFEDMIRYWVHTMDLGSNPKDGGQKESLPGDDLVLLSVQLINHVHRFDIREERRKIGMTAAALLEYAMTYSPYNAYLKIAAMKQHLENGCTVRAQQVFDDINIKQIQLESCSYFILNELVNNGLYKEAVEQAGKIVNLHSTSEKDLCSYMPRAFENGNIQKGLEMIRWQRKQMSRSLQLVEAKGIIMDLAPFLGYEHQLNVENDSHVLGSRCGLVGAHQDEGERAEKIVRDSTNFYAAPSILNLAKDKENIENKWCDNRDFTVHDYEILERSNYEFHPFESIARAHEHCILTKMVMVSQIIKPPKKGKVVKVFEGEILDKRSKSLLKSIDAAESFFSDDNNKQHKCNQSRRLLLQAAAIIARAFSVIVTGKDDVSSPPSSTDKLEQREEKVIPMLQAAQRLIQNASSYWGAQSKADMTSSTLRLVPDVVIMVLAILNICANACTVFGWGKRKRSTKPVAKCMADLALYLKTFLTDMSMSLDYDSNYSTIKDHDETHEEEEGRTFVDSNARSLSQIIDLLPNSHDLIEQMIRDCDNQNKKVQARIQCLLMQMANELNTFDVNDL